MIERIQRSSRGVGDLLMDQSVVAGIGNVYRAEALFVTGMHPLRPGTDCDRAELEALWSAAQGMLRQGVKDNRIVTVRPRRPRHRAQRPHQARRGHLRIQA